MDSMKQVTWSENVQKCLNLDMTPLRLDSVDVKKALDTFAKSIPQ